jgi:hypothetical protein
MSNITIEQAADFIIRELKGVELRKVRNLDATEQ